MTTVASLLEIAFVFAVTLTPVAIAARLLRGWTDDFGSILLLPTMGWPKGVQEEEPQPWKIGPTAAWSPRTPGHTARNEGPQPIRGAEPRQATSRGSS